MSTIISPSLLSGDFRNLEKEITMINQSEADWLHLDVMDGVFVPNLTFGFPVIKAISTICQKPLDVHLMIVKPERYIAETAQAGANLMTIHLEACTHLNRTINAIKSAGMKAGVALNPSTPIVMLEDVLNDVDVVELMGVNPGFSGQKFIDGTIDKTRRLRQMIDKIGSTAIIEIDGGVNAETGKKLVEAGADMLVSGSYVFKSPNPTETIAQLKRL